MVGLQQYNCCKLLVSDISRQNLSLALKRLQVPSNINSCWMVHYFNFDGWSQHCDKIQFGRDNIYILVRDSRNCNQSIWESSIQINGLLWTWSYQTIGRLRIKADLLVQLVTKGSSSSSRELRRRLDSSWLGGTVIVTKKNVYAGWLRRPWCTGFGSGASCCISLKTGILLIWPYDRSVQWRYRHLAANHWIVRIGVCRTLGLFHSCYLGRKGI